MRRLFPLLLALAAPALAQDAPVPPVSRWESLPRLAYLPDYKPRVVWVERAHALAGSKGCTLPAPVDGIVRLRVPFAVLLDASAKVVQAQAEMPGCPALARLVEQFAMQQGPKTLVAAGGTAPEWRASHFLAGWPAVIEAPAAEAVPPPAAEAPAPRLDTAPVPLDDAPPAETPPAEPGFSLDPPPEPPR